MKKKALIVGIDNYNALSSLKGCVNDAKEIANAVEHSAYSFDTTVLLDGVATRKGLRAAIGDVLSNSNFSLFYFAGHGIRTAVSTYLATVDSEPDDEGLDIKYIVDAVAKLTERSQTVVILLDCCHAGDASLFRGGPNVVPMATSDIPTLSGNGRLIMAACLGDQKAQELEVNGKHHGLFTTHLLDALNGKAADRDCNVTVSATYEYVSAALEKAGTQRPMLRGDQSGRIIIGTGVKPTGAPLISTTSYLSDEIVKEAQQHVENYFDAVETVGLKDYESRGHREACQRLSPIIDWFQNRIDDDGKLLQDQSFKKSWAHIMQQYQQLSSITTGIVLNHEREVGDFIGSGTFGSVWKIRDPNRVTMCFKSYHATELRDLEKVARFNRGYRAMTQLDHPNIVKVYESTVVPFGFYMQYIEGPNLRDYNPSTSFDIEQTLELMLEVGETLAHAHGRNVLHRDVKPENILVQISDTNETQPFLTDFDLSWFSTATKLTRLAGDCFGSHFYAAPEQMNAPASQAAHRPTVDAYSFGQVLFFSVSGRDPAILDELGNQRMFSEHLSKCRITEKTASQLSQLYTDCTAKNPDKRVGDFREICDRLSSALSICRAPGNAISSNQFLQELRFLMNGAISKRADEALHGAVTVKSPSGRTDISLLVKKDDASTLGFEAIFIPGQSPVIGGKADPASARRIVNSRIDNALAKFTNSNGARRTSPTGGAFQSIVNFDAIAKNASGLSRCRELLMSVVNCIERE